jgi:hypothetical protein
MILWAGYVDRGHSKVANLALACGLSACGFLGAILFADNLWVSVAWMAVAVTGVNGARAIFWTIPPRFLTGIAAAGGLAFINSIGTTGGFVGPYVFGWLPTRPDRFQRMLAMSGFLLLLPCWPGRCAALRRRMTQNSLIRLRVPRLRGCISSAVVRSVDRCGAVS